MKMNSEKKEKGIVKICHLTKNVFKNVEKKVLIRISDK